MNDESVYQHSDKQDAVKKRYDVKHQGLRVFIVFFPSYIRQPSIMKQQADNTRNSAIQT